jgi:hypothetical protein
VVFSQRRPGTVHGGDPARRATMEITVEPDDEDDLLVVITDPVS